MTGFHVLEELQTVLHRKLSLHDLVHWLFEVFGGETFHEASGTAIVLDEDPLCLVDALFLIEVVLVIVDPLPALVTLRRPLPGEVLTIGIRLSLVVGAYDLRPELLTHEFLNGHGLLSRVRVSRLRLPQRLILRKQTHGVHQVQICIPLQILISM